MLNFICYSFSEVIEDLKSLYSYTTIDISYNKLKHVQLHMIFFSEVVKDLKYHTHR